MKEYSTEQRRVLLSFFKENEGEQFSADNVFEALSSLSPVSRSSVYRNIDRMVQEGLLRKTMPEAGRKALYQYIDCERHCDRLHLRCEKCDRVFHLPNETDENGLKTVLESNGFQLDEQATVLEGVCKDCTGK